MEHATLESVAPPSWRGVGTFTHQLATATHTLFMVAGLYIKAGLEMAGGSKTAEMTMRKIYLVLSAFKRLYQQQVACVQLPTIGVDVQSARGKPVFYGTHDSVPIGVIADVGLRDGISWALVRLKPLALPTRNCHFAFQLKAHVVCELVETGAILTLDRDDPDMLGLSARIHSLVLRDIPCPSGVLPLPSRLAVHCCF